MKEPKLDFIVTPILEWYDIHKRTLPWRESPPNPYRVWVSEIMLQQTRVEAVKGYFERFMIELPTIESLATIDDERLLKLWEGLGYYNRVRNLKKGAQVIVNEYEGEFPKDYEGILRLPGVGEYTAGAISSIVFGKPIPAVDGNVMRVIARFTENHSDIMLPATKRQITQQLQVVYPLADLRCGDFTQSLMELGALVCVPNGAPKCLTCPLSTKCCSYHNGTQNELPVKMKKKSRKKENRTVFILCYEGKVAMQKRSDTGLLSGLWEFPNIEGWLTQKEAETQLLAYGITAVNLKKGIDSKHIFTHIEWNMTSYLIECSDDSQKVFSWVTQSQLESEIALPTAFKKFKTMIKFY